MGGKVRVLHIDDEPGFADLCKIHLERESDLIDVETVTEPQTVMGMKDLDTFDCIVSDFDMPGINGIELLQRVRETYPDLPFILFTGKGSEEVASEAIASGVTDYLQKGGEEKYSLLANRIEKALDEYRMQDFRKRLQYDPLTLIENFDDPVYVLNGEWEFTYLNEPAGELFGRERESLLGKVIWEEFPEATETDFFDTYQQVVDENVSKIIVKPFEPWSRWYREYLYPTDNGLIILSREITREKALQEQQAAEQRTFQTFANVLPHGIYRSDPETFETLFANQPFYTIHGVDTPEEIHAGFWTESLHPEDKSRIAETFNACRETGTPGELEYRIVTMDGDVRWVRDTFAWEVDENGSILALVGVYTDISDVKEREDELSRYRFLVEHVADPMYILDEAGCIQMANTALAEVLGRSKADILGSHVKEFIREGDSKAGTQRIKELLQDDGTHTAVHEFRLKEEIDDKSYFETRFVVLSDNADITGSVGVVRDITEKREQLEEFEASEERLRVALEAGNLGMWELDLQTEESPVRSFRHDQIFGYDEPLEDWSFDIFLEHVHPDDRAMITKKFEEAFEGGSWQFTCRIQRIDGVNRWINAQGTFFYDDENEPSHAVGIVKDVTDEKETILELGAKTERLDEFARMVSHDIKNPLTIAKGRLTLYRERSTEDDLEAVEQAVSRIEEITTDLLQLARFGSPDIDSKPVSLRDTAHAGWQMIDTLDAELKVTDQNIIADRSQLQGLFENVFKNAVGHGGKDVEVRVGPYLDGFFIEDTGVGIPRAHQDRVFESGFSTGYGGSGIGLTIVSRIVEAHGWHIELTESAEGGTRFEITGVEFA